MKEKWMLRRNTSNLKDLSEKTGLNEIITHILTNRGITELDDIHKFTKASLDDLHNPFLLKDMEKGTEIILDAITFKKKITVYGDYDVDGVTSTVILYKALNNCGANVNYYIPDRESEGYGINSDRIKKLKDEGTEVIITCDNGISAIEQVALAKQLGITVVVTDHHELSFTIEEDEEKKFVLPEAEAVINPKQQECRYPFKSLCGAGIAFKFAEALYKKMQINSFSHLDLLEFAGIGTICDVVDLKGENRIIARNSLKILANTNNLGLKTLIKVLGLENKKLNSGTIGFQIGPCINATGRLETAELSVELLLTDNEERAYELANLLNDLNKKRQYITTKNVETIIEKIESSELKNDKVLVVYQEDLHESIAGIVAGRIKERFNVPSIVITKGKEMPKGSGRSIEDYNLFEELLKCKNLLHKFGGHPMAAGLSLMEENINKLREELNNNCSLSYEDLIPKIKIDVKLPIKDLDRNLLQELENLEPFGKGNETPVIAEKNLLVDRIFIIGKDSNVLRLSLRQGNRKIDGIIFNKVDEFKKMLQEEYGSTYMSIIENPKDLRLDIIYFPFINKYNGFESIQLRISNFRISKA